MSHRGVSKLVVEQREQITNAWRARIAETLELAALPPSNLGDSLPALLLGLGSWIDGATERGFLDLVDQHARLRQARGIELRVVLAEYRVLREVLLAETLATVADDLRGIVELNRGLDLACAEAAGHYSLHRGGVRDRFVGILGHDLRNPLMSLTLAAETVIATPCPHATHARLATTIKAGGERMGRMVSDLVDFTLGQLGDGIPCVPQTSNLGDICREAFDDLHAAHPDRAIELQATGGLVGSFDHDRVVQVISNLVTNAVVHGSDPITIRVHEDAEHVITEVHNMGTAIAAEALPDLFDPFRPSPRRRTGLGLGLYIVQQIALAHGAACIVDSTEERGTTFRIAWPRQTA